MNSILCGNEQNFNMVLLSTLHTLFQASVFLQTYACILFLTAAHVRQQSIPAGKGPQPEAAFLQGRGGEPSGPSLDDGTILPQTDRTSYPLFQLLF